MNEAFAANNYGYTTWTFWPPESETYIIEEIEKVWAGDMTAEEYLQGIRTSSTRNVRPERCRRFRRAKIRPGRGDVRPRPAPLMRSTGHAR